MSDKPDNLFSGQRTPEEVDQLIISRYPYPIALNYRHMLETKDWEKKTRRAIEVFELGLRAITLGVLSQYLIRDLEKIKDSELNQELDKYFPKNRNISLGTWVNFLFLCLKAYKNKRELLFMPELYDVYWDTSRRPHEPRKGVRAPYVRLIQIRNEVSHSKFSPQDEGEWKEKGQVVLQALRKILGQFQFLKNYDLIRIFSSQGEEYEFERFTGQDVTVERGRLRGDDELSIGWFYLARRDHSVLKLHPLLIFGTRDKQMKWFAGDKPDVAVFDLLMGQYAEYIAMIIGRAFKEQDATLISQLRELFYYNLEEVKMAPKRVIITWKTLQEKALEVSEAQMQAVRQKYNKASYLQRQEILQSFHEFLASDKNCFILTGKSGVGKSNFVLSLMDEFKSEKNIMMLMYDGARLLVPEDLEKAIAQDLSKYLELDKSMENNFFTTLQQAVEMENKIFLIVFDAINESMDGRALLRKIDGLVDQAHYPWLKILVTSRPEAWRLIKKGVRLADTHYFRQKDREEHWKLEQVSVKLEPFQRDELEDAYEKYSSFFDLRTSYHDLKPSVRVALRDPLALRLVAKTYTGREIPNHIRVNDIYDKYIQALVDSNLLNKQDILFLEQILMPLMLERGHYDNRITTFQIQSARTSYGIPLWELLFNEDLYPNLEPVNASFKRLVDAEILIQYGSALDTIITFDYERLYEFFGGRRLYQISRQNQDPFDYYYDVASQLTDRIFLWGALIQALFLELKQGNLDLVSGLAPVSSNNRLLKSALVEALSHFGEDDFRSAEVFIRSLIGPLTPLPNSLFAEIRRLFGPAKDPPLQGRPKMAIAIDAAARLKIADLLEDLAVEPSPWLRNLAAQNIFFLWKQNPHDGIRLLERLTNRVRINWLPDLGVTWSILSITGVILSEEHDREETLRDLLAIGRKALRRLFYLGQAQKRGFFSRVRRILIGVLYNLIFVRILSFGFWLLDNMRENAVVNIEGMEQVFDLSPEEKLFLLTFIPFLNPDTPGLEERVDDMVAVFEWGDFYADSILGLSILGRGALEFDETLSIVRKLTGYAEKTKPPRVWITHPCWTLFLGASKLREPKPELMEIIETICTAIQQDPESYAALALKTRRYPGKSDHRTNFLGTYVAAHYEMMNEIDFPILIRRYLDRAVQTKDTEYLRYYIRHELGAILNYGFHRAAVLGVEPITRFKDEKTNETILHLLIRAHNFDPYLTEDLLFQMNIPEKIVNRILAEPIEQRFIDLFTDKLIPMMYDLFVLGPPSLRIEFQWLASQALTLPNKRVWLITIISELVNIIVGERVFNVPKDAPSKQLPKV